MTAALYSTTDYYEGLVDSVDADAERFLETLSQLSSHYVEERRADSIAHDLLRMAKTVKTLDAEIAMLQAHKAEVGERAEAKARRRESLKAWMANLYQQAGIEGNIKDPFATVWMQPNPPSCEVTDEAAVPAMYKRVNVTLPWAQARELLPDDVLATARVDVLRQAILDEAKVTGAVPAGVSVITGKKSLRVK